VNHVRQAVLTAYLLRQTSTILTGAALASAAAKLVDAGEDPAGEKKPWPLRLSTSTVQFSSLSVEKACERIAALGFTASRLLAWGLRMSPSGRDRETPGPEGLRDMLAKSHLKLYAFTCYNVGPITVTPGLRSFLARRVAVWRSARQLWQDREPDCRNEGFSGATQAPIGIG